MNGYVFENLNNFDESLNLVPSLASLPEILNNGLILKYKLRDDVYFSNGKKLSSDDVIFTFKAAKSKLFSESYEYYLENIDSVNAVGNELSFYLRERKWRTVINIAGMPIVPFHLWDPKKFTMLFSFNDINTGNIQGVENFKDYINSVNLKTDFKTLIGSGPYVYNQYKKDTAVVLNKSKKYWKSTESPSYLDKLIFFVIGSEDVSVEMIKAGLLDFSFVQNVEAFSDFIDKKSNLILKFASRQNLHIHILHGIRKYRFSKVKKQEEHFPI